MNETQERTATLTDVDRLLAAMGSSWMKARALSVILGWPDRKVRAVAAKATPKIVSFPGSPGYKKMEHCTADEIVHCVNSLRRQGNEMLTRAAAYCPDIL